MEVSTSGQNMSCLKSKYHSYVSARRASRHAGTDVTFIVDIDVARPTVGLERVLGLLLLDRIRRVVDARMSIKGRNLQRLRRSTPV